MKAQNEALRRLLGRGVDELNPPRPGAAVSGQGEPVSAGESGAGESFSDALAQLREQLGKEMADLMHQPCARN